MNRMDDAGMLDRAAWRSDPEVWSAASPDGAVATAHWQASDAGVEILRRGGNAIDAAVAASLALAVCEPAGSGLGGMAMAVVHLGASGRTFTVEGPCRAPLLATREEVLQTRKRYRGYDAVAVPTHLAVLEHLRHHYGSRSATELVAGAREIAGRGILVTHQQRALTLRYLDAVRSHSAARMFLDGEGEPWPVGHRIDATALARTLDRLAAAGFEDFYRGEIAAAMDRDMREQGGFVRAADLEATALVGEGTPVTALLGTDSVHTLGPPGGGTALAWLLLLHGSAPEVPGPDSPDWAPWMAALIRRARQDRRDISRAGTAEEELLDPERAAQVVRELRDAQGEDPGSGEGETSHLCTADRDGNLVSLTQSIERSFGAAVLHPELGFLYNGYLRTFKRQNRRHRHFLRPGAVARSNAAPTVVTRGGVARLALGSTGSERMISGIFQTLVRLGSDTPFGAVHGPRLHCTPEGEVLWEAERFPTGSRELLRARGFTPKDLRAYSFETGGTHLIARAGDSWVAVADPRRDGAAGVP